MQSANSRQLTPPMLAGTIWAAISSGLSLPAWTAASAIRFTQS